MGHSPQADCDFPGDSGDNGGPVSSSSLDIYGVLYDDTAPAKREAPISVEDPSSRCGLTQKPRSITADSVGADCSPKMMTRPARGREDGGRKRKEESLESWTQPLSNTDNWLSIYGGTWVLGLFLRLLISTFRVPLPLHTEPGVLAHWQSKTQGYEHEYEHGYGMAWHFSFSFFQSTPSNTGALLHDQSTTEECTEYGYRYLAMPYEHISRFIAAIRDALLRGQQRVVTTAQAMCVSGSGRSDIVIAVGNRVSASVNTQLLLASTTLSRHKTERYISRTKGIKALEPQMLRDDQTLPRAWEHVLTEQQERSE
ncbi:hypothetical protein CSAL01_00659 [Colletotrichum salicis]|uniref:Uncharacterized protein n=1 Tax=Colletotrichum salicis TaxID=1209931 RepID=A0A135V5M0_9PEZI|nr:hypothetical protein CSAL01_00659 [Colletotrichum salicis]